MLEGEGLARAPTQPERPKTPEFLPLLRPRPMKTPSGGQDLLKSSRNLAKSCPSFHNPTLQLFSQKASKALDVQAAKIAELEARNAYLVAKLER